jgi:hypothetical protein
MLVSAHSITIDDSNHSAEEEAGQLSYKRIEGLRLSRKGLEIGLYLSPRGMNYFKRRW